MAIQNDNGSPTIETMYSEFAKNYLVYEAVTFRLLTIYEAPTHALHGQPCMRTDYEYDGASTRILKSKESSAVWDSAWDI